MSAPVACRRSHGRRCSPRRSGRRSAARAIIVVALGVAIVVNALLAGHTREAIESLERWEFALVRQARILEGEVPELLSDGRGYLLTEDPRFLDDFAEDRHDARTALAQLRDLVRTTEGWALVDTIDGRLEGVVRGVEHRIDLARQGRFDEARVEFLGARAAQAELFSLLDELVDREEALLEARMDDIQRERVLGLAGGGILLTAVGVLAVVLLSRGRRVLEESWERERAALIESEVLRQADQIKSALLSSVSHDLRTPLTTIKASATSLLNEGVAWDSNARRELLRAVDAETDRLSWFVSRLLDLSRVEAGAAQPHKGWHAVADILEGVADRLDPRGERVHLAVGDGPPVVRVDYVIVEQIVANLLENGLKYSPAGAPVEVSAEVRAGRLTIAVADRGPGVPPSERERIFEKFYRAPGRPAEAGGSGIGLAIARGLARAHDGDVTYRPRPGGGSVFVLDLALRPGRREEAAS